MSYNAAMSYIADRDTVSGSVISVSVKDDKIQLVVKNRHSGPRRVLVTLDEAASERSAENARACTSEAFAEAYARTGAFAYTSTVIEARGEYTEISSADDPGCFDYSLYMKSKGVTVRFKAYILEVTDAEIPLSSRIRLSLFSARERFISRFDTEMQGFIRGVIFGDRDYTYTKFPAQLSGAEAVLTACDSKKYAGDQASFKADADISAFVALDTRITDIPAWLNDWTKTADTLTDDESP